MPPRKGHVKKLGSREPDFEFKDLKSLKLLRVKEAEGFKSIYICPDRSVEERKAFKKLLEELRAMKSAETDSDKVHLIRNNKIITIDKKRDPAPTG